tara:strand:- start:95 stop:835 length:741 start_codon:yes stop_codon:yes gene_type:complete
MNSVSPDLYLMIKACEKASKVLIRDFGEIEKLQVSIKGPSDFVTNSDYKVEKIIINELSKSKKKYYLISEESGKIENENKSGCWIIDPIDGTTNFLNGIPHFAISIALKIKNEIISGVIYDPIKDEMFYAEKNNGAYLNNKRIRVSKKNNLDNCLFATGGKNEIKTKLNIRKFGSASLDLAYVAAGRYDGFFQKNLSLWDVAAGLILIKESGGKVNKINLERNNNVKIYASNNSIHEKMLDNIDNF